jgi:hypothetical protein
LDELKSLLSGYKFVPISALPVSQANASQIIDVTLNNDQSRMDTVSAE